MKQLLLILFFGIGFQVAAQPTNGLHGIVRKNYFSVIFDPTDSTRTYEKFDSATVRLGITDPKDGMVYNFGSNSYNMPINLTGAALNPYTNSYTFISTNTINTMNLSTGLMTNSALLTNPIQASYFDNFRFNNADSSMYGLARRNVYDPATQSTIGQVFLAKVNTQTGVITQISKSSVGFGFALAGSAIDPYQMVYYYSTGANLVGLDIYDGSVFSSVPIQITGGIVFDNFTYSCADTALYGLIRQNYFSYQKDPSFPMDSIEVLDSTSIKLGRINPKTGVVTTISPYSLRQGGYSLNAGSAIDPSSMTYYFNPGGAVVGVSLITGLMVSNKQLTFEDGMYFDLMRNFENCISASAFRSRGGSTGIRADLGNWQVDIRPNPAQGSVVVAGNFAATKYQIISLDGKFIEEKAFGSNLNTIDMSALESGIYFITVFGKNGEFTTRKLVKTN